MYLLTLAQITIFAISAALCGLLVPICIKAAVKWNILDYPTWRKTHKAPTPFLGGVAIFVSFWTIVGLGFLVSYLYLEGIGLNLFGFLEPFKGYLQGGFGTFPKMFQIFLGSLIIFLLGLCDDVKSMKALPKLIVQCVAALILVLSGYRIDIFGLPPVFGYLASFIWTITLINAFNFIDSLDGHLTGVSIVAGVFFFLITQLLNQPLVSIVLLVLLGALFGFLPYNFYPARIFLGDAGSTFLGYIFAAITIISTYGQPQTTAFTFLFPVCVFSVPLYDTISVILIRLFTKKPIYIGDRNHFAYRLVELGMSERIAVMFSFLVATACGLIALLLYTVNLVGVVLIVLIYLCLLAVIAFLEIYVTRRLRLTAELAKKFHRRRTDIAEAE